MPTRKQRRRRAKERRHEYEYVYVDEEGREVEVEEEEAEERARRNGSAAAKPVTRAGRTIDPPSWRKVGRRALIFAPLMFVALTIIGSELSMTQRIAQTLLMLGFFLPFSYLTDRMLYRAALRRAEQPQAGRRR
ncbi:MAG TPA: hypothetical protein VE615_02655 [Gaiellaceae bacterium]|jgi:hypothetical protein|nr:hypothetical protein [Gaiellaceae bacterium]